MGKFDGLPSRIIDYLSHQENWRATHADIQAAMVGEHVSRSQVTAALRLLLGYEKISKSPPGRITNETVWRV